MLHSARPSSLTGWLLTSMGSLCAIGTAFNLVKDHGPAKQRAARGKPD